MLREATTNVVRHSEARSCTIRVIFDDDGAGLTVVNNSASVSGWIFCCIRRFLLSFGCDIWVVQKIRRENLFMPGNAGEHDCFFLVACRDG